MKTLLIALFVVLAGSTYAQKCKTSLTVEFRGIEEGYDHTVKEEIYVDGKLFMTTEEHKESETTTTKMKLPRGQHSVMIVSWTLYEGTWEKMTQDNNYSLDGFRQLDYEFKKKCSLNMLFDLDDRDSPYLTIN